MPEAPISLSRPRRWSLALALAGGVYGLYVVTRAARTDRAPAPPLAPGFAGSAACAGCHPEAAAEHRESNHARALRTTAELERSTLLPEPAWLPDPDLPVAYRIARRGPALGVEAQAGAAGHWQPLSWAFGSGAHGVTPVGEAGPGRFVEAPISFYRQAGWDFTVGFVTQPPAGRRATPTGTPLESRAAFECFHCHATGVRESAAGPVLAGIERGIGCERCHGPGQPHVQAARAGRGAAEIETPGRGSARATVEFCATCHRLEPPPGVRPGDPVVVRFAPVGFLQSRCFRQSGDRFSCLSCHSAHGNVSRDPGFYRRVCAGCHGGPSGGGRCPRPGGDCVGCHMPRAVAQRNVVFTDHRIQIVGAPGR